MVMGMSRRARADQVPQQVQDRPRDIMQIINNATDRGDPVDEVIGADEYGKRPTRYEHREIVLSNEHLAIIAHIQNIVTGAEENVAKLKEYANSLIATFQDRVISFTVLVNREKDVIGVSYDTLKELDSRIRETRNAQTNPTPRGNGNAGNRANGSGEPVGEELQHPSDEEGARTPQAQIHR